MKRFLILFFFFLVSIFTFGQSVLGIPLGSSYEKTKHFLHTRSVGDNMWERDGKIFVTNGYIGNIPFGLGIFNFRFKDDSSYLYAVSLSDVELTSNQAKSKRETFADVIKEKYYGTIREYIDDTGFKRYEFGINPLDKNEPLGKIFIVHNRNTNKYDTVLYYGPIKYIEENSDF